jgi:hypothetical protein
MDFEITRVLKGKVVVTFRARGCWEETPVSIADPAGTEIDAKFVCAESGDLKIILAPILRFSDKVFAKFEF